MSSFMHCSEKTFKGLLLHIGFGSPAHLNRHALQSQRDSLCSPFKCFFFEELPRNGTFLFSSLSENFLLETHGKNLMGAYLVSGFLFFGFFYFKFFLFENVQEKYRETAYKMETTTYTTWKYKGIDITEIAKLIRKDIKKEIPDIKTSVRVERYSMGRSITVEIKEAPFIVRDPRYNRDKMMSEDNQLFTPIARIIRGRVKGIMDKYNYDNSEIQTDYYNVGFSGFVNFARELEEKTEQVPGKYTEEAMGRELVRYDTKRDYTEDELKEQRDDMEKSAKEGKLICLSDMIGNHEKKHIQNLGI